MIPAGSSCPAYSLESPGDRKGSLEVLCWDAACSAYFWVAVWGLPCFLFAYLDVTAPEMASGQWERLILADDQPQAVSRSADVTDPQGLLHNQSI